jgi:SAM-dependent methyltransferase
MAFRLESVVPWGRALSEYLSMFALAPGERRARILDCAGGPSSFNAEMRRRGNQVVPCDPIYEFSAEEIAHRIRESYPTMLEATRAHKENFVWTTFGSVEQLGVTRMEAMQQFLADFLAGRREGRYVVAELPFLPFADRTFDLALCSHFLFTYSDRFSADFHLKSIIEMCRVAREARVFRLLTAFAGEPSPHLQSVTDGLRERGFSVEVRRVDYAFQKGGNRMLSVRSSQ